MKKNTALFISIFCFCSLFLLSPETIEENLLKKKEQRILNYSYQVRVGARTQKIIVLDQILEEFDSIKYSKKDKRLVDLVIYLSEEGSTRQEYENNRLVNDFPDVRRKACMVLGKLGGNQAREALVDTLVNDVSSTVRAEACNALGEIKDNVRGEALRAMVYSYRTTYKPSQNFVFAIINAVKSIARGNSSAYGDAILVLSEIQMGQYNRKTREAAYDAIKYLNNIE